MKFEFSNLLNDLPIKGGTIIAATLGGVVALVNMQNISPRKAVAMIFSGAVMAAYIAPLLGTWLGYGEQVESGVSFIIGLLGMKVAKVVIEFLTFIAADPKLFLSLIMTFIKLPFKKK